jgi:pimeloyl-ACP methyl ester carboxylesterase
MKKPYKIEIDPAIVDDLQYRLARTRWPDEMGNENWEMGANSSYLKELCSYWARDFKWETQQNYLNSFSHFKADIDGLSIHFIHEKGKGEHSIPLLLIHGFPDSFVRFLKVIPLLTEADEDGFSFDLVIPSLPGYGFSDIPKKPGMNQERIAEVFSKLMTDELGYSRYMVHGGDWGSGITEQMAIKYPDRLEGIHLTDVPWYHLMAMPAKDLTDAEKKYMERGQQWSKTGGSYAFIQSTKPQSLAYGFNDSPAGLAGWIIEKFHGWSDCNGNLENCFTKDELLTNLMIYWSTQTMNSAMRLYYEAGKLMPELMKRKHKRPEVPAAVTMFPHDLVSAPREFAERIFNVRQWTESPKGGHFTAMEQPEMVATDIRKFGKTLKGIMMEENVVHPGTDLK